MPHRDEDDPPRRRANKRRGHGNWDNDRPPVCGAVGRESGRARLHVERRTDRATLERVVVGSSREGATVYTDEWRGYDRLRETGRGHATVCHAVGEWARDDDGDGVREVHSFGIGSGVLSEDLITGDPPGPGEIRKLRERIEDFFADVELEHPDQAVAVGGSATSLRRLVGAVLEYETLERGVRVLTSDPAVEVAKMFELDPRRVEVLAAGVLLLEQFSQMLGQPLQIGKGGLREGVILEMLTDGDGAAVDRAA